ncbi:hypothetical protein FA09DRAFT_358107 [Tilletiopsis washingtonensis]|uniref:Uncharacterized protein n=1 Tax=Tilletiopsis washingtonensis TaxID=58919 RepID=A0A316ZIG7_9BASI|nr:hypothetical protein FA09DRAFT_358107 [Tilletiopsis washingtonensis]PWO00743.1 hypothetical protein FA09DRAFT_358107 [Tilletiopsis washingtonensis]
MAEPAPATLMPLTDLRFPDDLGEKVRVAGFLTAFDALSSLGVLSHGGASLLVDFALVLAGAAVGPRLKSKALVLGELESAACYPRVPGELLRASPDALPPQPAPQRNAVLRAVLLRDIDDVDLHLWERAARVQSLAMQERAARRRRERAEAG